MQLRTGGGGWNLERKLCRGRHGERLAHDGATGADRGISNVIKGVRLNHAALYGSLLLLLVLHPLGERSQDYCRFVWVLLHGVSLDQLSLPRGLRVRRRKAIAVIRIASHQSSAHEQARKSF